VNREICEKSVNRLLEDYNNLMDYKYLIVTGGTGESRFEQIKEMLSGIEDLTVLPGNLNNRDLSFMYSNVIGYYMFRHAKMKAAEKKAAEANA
jgi:plasmid segregation protein ParM